VPGGIVRIGFVPLVDCALLAIAQERGFFARQHVDVELRKAQSWAQVRDKLATRELDAAHLLLTIPLQAALAAPGEIPLPYAFTLSRNGNGIILANALWNDGVRDGAGLAAWLAARPGRVLRLGVVFPRGTQEYFLRSWLLRGGLMIGERIQLSIIPPQEMVGRLRKGEIDGFCAGEPWSRRAAASKLGRLVAESAGLLPGLGEKVLGARADWHRGHTLDHARLLRALAEAGAWMADPANLEAAIDIVASKRYVNTPRTVVEGALRDAQASASGGRGAFRPYGEGPYAPAKAHARWYLDQMIRWGHTGAEQAGALDLSALCLEAFHASALSTAMRPSAAPTAPAVGGLALRV
jgi:ABC-type nitrate/sulfonate/bicarbonate transport system substrate-binding protein